MMKHVELDTIYKQIERIKPKKIALISQTIDRRIEFQRRKCCRHICVSGRPGSGRTRARPRTSRKSPSLLLAKLENEIGQLDDVAIAQNGRMHLDPVEKNSVSALKIMD